MKAEEYKILTEKATGNSPIVKNSIFAFVIGGLICVLGQFITDMLLLLPDINIEKAKMLTPIILIFLSALFTGLGLYEKLAKYGGAGTLVPITGFANAMVSPAIEFKTEGFILGTGPKLFTIAGPVIVYGAIASVVYGVVYYAIKCI